MPDTYKLQYDGMTLTYPEWNGYVSYEAAPAFKTLTLYHSEGGTLTANELTGYPGDTINLSTAYNTYWRFSGYQWTGDGSLVGNTYTFGTEDASICACYKVNAFTASGGWEKGSDVVAIGKKTTITSSVNKFAITSYHTSNVPTAWYSTSNRWKVTSTVSAYSINLKPIMKVRLQSESHGRGGSAYFSTNIGGSYTNTASNKLTGTSNATITATYSKNITTATTGVNYSISARIRGVYDNYYAGTATYLADETTGTWVATGIIP